MPSSQVKFFKGDLSTYQITPSLYVDGIFFDTTNHEIYVNGTKYSERRWSYLNDASLVISDSIPMLALDFDDYLGSLPRYVRLFKVIGKDAISTSLDISTGDVSVSLDIDNSGNSETWLTQSANGLAFAEGVLSAHTLNGIGILSNDWLTGEDVSVGAIPSVTDGSLAIEANDNIATAIQKVKRLIELKDTSALKKVYLEAPDGSLNAVLNDTSILEKVTFREGSYITIVNPLGDSSNTLVVSTTLHAGSNITISQDGAINAEGGTFWQEID